MHSTLEYVKDCEKARSKEICLAAIAAKMYMI